MKCCLEVVCLKIREIGQDLSAGQSCGIEVKYVAHADPHPTDAGFAAALFRVVSDPRAHEIRLGAPR
jgi:hypothetical protein